MKIFNLIIYFIFSLNLNSCSKGSNSVSINSTIPSLNKSLIALPPGWKISGKYGLFFPPNIQVYEFDSIFQNNKVKATCVVFNSKDTTIEFKPVLASGLSKPSDFFSNEKGTVYMCINGGYFGGTSSYSLVKYNNQTQSPNVRAVTRLFGGLNTTYYPTRAAFGILQNKQPDISWIYHPEYNDDTIYCYSSPSPNLINNPPVNQPTKSYPIGARPWNTISAIGGSPVLIKDSIVNITDAQELISIDNNINRSRSAIGFTQNGIIILIAVQGNNPIYSGINLSGLASILYNLGCTNAINLDGGSSTSLIIGGQMSIMDGGSSASETPVKSAIIIKLKQ